MKECTRCGRCCTNDRFMASMPATGDDIARWRAEGRHDILQWAVIIGDGADLWISPRTGEAVERCPFVRKDRNANTYRCLIYNTRPDVCVNYPVEVGHMAAVDCDMLEDGDSDDDVDLFMAERRMR